VWLRVVFDSLSAHSDGLSFRCNGGGQCLPCGITDTALRELIDFHRVQSNECKALRTILSEIERLVNAKGDAGRYEENGCIVIWPVDLLRYGYQSREPSAA
jgi:hypothetical protein